jgi:hypothetical protein
MLMSGNPLVIDPRNETDASKERANKQGTGEPNEQPKRNVPNKVGGVVWLNTPDDTARG